MASAKAASAAEQQHRFDESVLAVARRHAAEHGATQDHFTTSPELRAVPLEALVQSLNRLLRAERLVAVRGGAGAGGGGAGGAPSTAGGGPMRYRVPTAADARTRGLGNEERMVLQRVREGGNAGVWTKDLRQRTNLSQPQVARILKALEARALVKAVKGVAHPSRKLFMLAELEPSREITGGAWYINNEFDEDFIAQLRRVCLKYVGGLPRGAAATVGDVAAFVRASGVFGVELQPEDVAVVLDTLYYDNLLDKLTAEEALAEARAHGVALRLEAEEEAAAAERAAAAAGGGGGGGGGSKRRRRQQRQQRRQRRGSAAPSSSTSTSSSSSSEEEEDDEAAAKVRSSGGSSSELGEGEEDDEEDDDGGGRRPGKKRGGRAGAGAAAAAKGKSKAKGAGRPRRPASSSGGGSMSAEEEEDDERDGDDSDGPSRSGTLDSEDDGGDGDGDDEDDGDFGASDEDGGGKKCKRRGSGKGGKRLGKKGPGGDRRGGGALGPGGGRRASGTPPAAAGGAPAARYRLAAHPLPPSGESAALAAPCGACPVAQECREGAQIAPQSCAYFRDWLDF